MALGLDQIFNTVSSALSAQSIRMNITASNLANAESTGNSEKTTFHSRHPVFEEVKRNIPGLLNSDQPIGGVMVSHIIQNHKPLEWHYDPDNPNADKEGRVFRTDVNPIEEMTDMIAAAQDYQADVEVMNTVKNLLLQTIHAMGS